MRPLRQASRRHAASLAAAASRRPSPHALRPSALRPRCTARHYTPSSEPRAAPFAPLEAAILSAALRHVPRLGFSSAAVAAGARDAGYPAAAAAAFAPFALVNFHLVSRRHELREQVRFAEPAAEPRPGQEPRVVGPDEVHRRLRTLVLARLRANAGVASRWQEALAIMALPSNVPAALAELARLADEMWFLAGDGAVDFSWYTRRAGLSAVYSAAEVYMTADTSPGFRDTEDFVDRRLREMHGAGEATGAVGEWLAYTGHSLVNVARSKGMRI